MVQGDLREMHRGSGGREGNGRSGCHRNRDNKYEECILQGKGETDRACFSRSEDREMLRREAQAAYPYTI